MTSPRHSASASDDGTLGDGAPVPGMPRSSATRAVDGGAAVDARGVMICEWFVLCDNVATVLVSHPYVGDVAACADCASRADGATRTRPIDSTPPL